MKKLLDKNVNKYTEDRDGLTYLSWAHAWEEVIKEYPDATYKIKKDDNNNPFFGNKDIGYMVYTEITIDEITREMWLPILDSKHKTIKLEPYQYKTRYGVKNVNALTMFDVNKAIMRCLTKNIAMFGLGIYIYSGEDLPTTEKEESEKEEVIKKEIWNELKNSNIPTEIKDEYITALRKKKIKVSENLLKEIKEIIKSNEEKNNG